MSLTCTWRKCLMNWPVAVPFLIHSWTSNSISKDREQERTLDSHDVACRTLESYRRELFYATGTITSTSTICHFWKNCFHTAANLRKANTVPINMFKPEEYWSVVLCYPWIKADSSLWMKRVWKVQRFSIGQSPKRPYHWKSKCLVSLQIPADFPNNWCVSVMESTLSLLHSFSIKINSRMIPKLF